jgi:hypothetical protein
VRAVLVAVLLLMACGSDNDQCSTECHPACAAGETCVLGAYKNDPQSAAFSATCLRSCARPADCASGSHCVFFSDATVCVPDDLPNCRQGPPVCLPLGTTCLGNNPTFLATDLTQTPPNYLCAYELTECPNGCIATDGGAACAPPVDAGTD